MSSDTVWAITGLLGVGGIVYQFATFVKRIKDEEDRKERRRPQATVYHYKQEDEKDSKETLSV